MAIVKVGQHSDQDDRGQDAAYDERPHQPCHSSASWNSAGLYRRWMRWPNRRRYGNGRRQIALAFEPCDSLSDLLFDFGDPRWSYRRRGGLQVRRAPRVATEIRIARRIREAQQCSASRANLLWIRASTFGEFHSGESPHGVRQIFTYCDPYLRAIAKMGHNI